MRFCTGVSKKNDTRVIALHFVPTDEVERIKTEISAVNWVKDIRFCSDEFSVARKGIIAPWEPWNRVDWRPQGKFACTAESDKWRSSNTKTICDGGESRRSSSSLICTVVASKSTPNLTCPSVSWGNESCEDSRTKPSPDLGQQQKVDVSMMSFLPGSAKGRYEPTLCLSSPGEWKWLCWCSRHRRFPWIFRWSKHGQECILYDISVAEKVIFTAETAHPENLTESTETSTNDLIFRKKQRRQ